MLDEYAHDAAAALTALDGAEKRYPGDIRLARVRAKIYYRKGEHAASLEAFEPIADAFPEDDAIERAFAFREAGISAAETGDLPKARRYFGKAYQAASKVRDHMLPMAAGLMGDCAVIEFQMENHEEALRCTAQALRDGDEINPEAGPREKYCTLILGHMILWMRSQVKGGACKGEDMPIYAGACSNPEPPDEIMERKTPPLLYRWYQLTELEAELGINTGIFSELRKRTAEREIISCEFTLIFSLMSRNIGSVDVDRFCSCLPEYVSKTAFMIKNRENLRNQDTFKPQTGTIQLLEREDWGREPYLGMAQDVILAFQVSAVCSGRSDTRDELAARIDDIEGASSALNPFLERFTSDLSALGNAREVAAKCIGRISDTINPLSPDELFLVTCYLWNWLAYSGFKLLLGPVLADFLAAQWRRVIEAQRFLLNQPMRTVPGIQAALECSQDGVAKMATIVLAAEDAVNGRLSVEMRELLKKSANSADTES